MDIKSFRGTLLLALLVGGVVIGVKALDPAEEEVEQTAERPLFVFEKQDLVKFSVERPDGVDLTLEERAEGWFIVETGKPAAKTQVNRTRHQLHDLVARASVVDNPEQPSLYGLGPEQAVRVTLYFRDGSSESFLAGDPNPTGVSYYMQREGEETIFTVKKSAVDYFSLDLEDFRERRFASFNAKDADRIEADLPQGRRLVIQRTSEKSWEMVEPVAGMSVSLDRARSLLGRISVLKETGDFGVELPDGDPKLAEYGLLEPRARIRVSFGTRAPLTLLVGDEVPTDDTQPHAWVRVEGQQTVFESRVGFLDDYLVDPQELRNPRFVGLDPDEIESWLVELNEDEDPGLVGVTPGKRVGDTWQWEDGRPVSGSTPKRVADRMATLDAEAFEDGVQNLRPYGLDTPVARVTLHDLNGEVVVVLLGDEGEPRRDVEDRVIPRIWATVEGSDSVYLVDGSALDVLQDARREHNKKLKKDAEKAERQEKIPLEATPE